MGYSENYCFEELDLLLNGKVPPTPWMSFQKIRKVLRNGVAKVGGQRGKIEEVLYSGETF